jgi:hypothetical protein
LLFWWDRGLNSKSHACKVGDLQLGPQCQSDANIFR